MNKHLDPSRYLETSVKRRGKSGFDGVYLTHITVTTNPIEDYSSETSKLASKSFKELEASTPEWNELLVSMRCSKELVHTILHKNRNFLEFISEGTDLSLCVILPSIKVNEFLNQVVYYQALLQKVSAFTGNIPIQVKFIVGVATVSWEEMVESGDALEVDVGL